MRICRILLISFIVFVLMELTCQVFYRVKYKNWIFTQSDSRQYHDLFIRHSYLVGAPKPLAAYTSKNKTFFTHNSDGFRGAEICIVKKPGVKRILAIGGSSTYGVGVSDNQTWPFCLEKDLGAEYEVINMGVPGYSTAENIIQTALQISDFSPNICVYYLGLNDLRNSHIKNLKADYSDFHGPVQYINLGVLPRFKFGNRIASLWFLRQIICKYLMDNSEETYGFQGPDDDKYTDKIDKRALSLYKRNLELIIELCRVQNVKLVMIPQVLDYSVLNKNIPTTWVPFIKEKDLRIIMAAYNDTMKNTCEKNNIIYAEEVLKQDFDAACFVDPWHFSYRGNKKFADIIAEYLRNLPT